MGRGRPNRHLAIYSRRALDTELKELHARAMAVPGVPSVPAVAGAPTSADVPLSAPLSAPRAALAGFTKDTVVETHLSVVELRKELEAAAQRQAQAKHDASY